MLQISPYLPLARFYLITFDWKNTEKLAAQWEKQEAGHSAVLLALGLQYSKLGRLDDAERCLKAAIEVAPVMSNYSALAEFYQEHGKTDSWLATMQKMLDLPDDGLDHARICNSIAGYYIGRRQWQKACPYAEGAAQSYSEWGLNVPPIATKVFSSGKKPNRCCGPGPSATEAVSLGGTTSASAPAGAT